MRKLHIISFIMIALLSFGTAFASSGGSLGGSGSSSGGSGSGGGGISTSVKVDIDYSDHSVTISGTSDAEYKYRNVSLQVLNPGKSMNNLLYGEDVLNWSDQGKTDSEGAYSFTYKITGDSGIYKVIIGIDGNSRTYRTSFEYFSPAEVNDVLAQIKECVSDNDTEGIASIIDENEELLQIDTMTYYELPVENRELVCKGITESSPETLNDFKALFEQGVAVQEINLADSHESYTEKLRELTGDEYSAVHDVFDTLDSATQNKIITDMMATDYTTSDAITEDYVDSVLLTKVESITIWGEMESFLTDVKDILGIDFTDYNKLSDKSKAIKEMLGESFSSLADIKKAFDKAVDNALDDEKNSTSSSTSGGGGGGGGYKTAPTTVVPVPDVNSIAQPGDIFSDLSQAQWAKESILSLCDKGIISGYSDKTFRPNNNVTRAEFLKMTVMLFNIKANPEAENKFEDVKKTDWHYEYVYAALSNGIVSGVSETEFNPDGLISRQDMAVILYRAATFAGKTYESGEISFSDKDSISDYATEAVAAFSKAGIINGYNNMFNPANTATRAEAAQILFNQMINGGI